ncbi:hypothetical protein DES40_0438 [Litorimonas taeanensis]|uniref:Uncharacterized protein n=1 Tax=Litorimonas taeanensis TaxID=568099 RepID=A0A420WJE4_9PROT|nr:hypothetical protein DES40_0438 [Litorimonas taeanensis]
MKTELLHTKTFRSPNKSSNRPADNPSTPQLVALALGSATIAILAAIVMDQFVSQFVIHIP